MENNVTTLDIDANKPHKAVLVNCIHCGHKWAAVCPIEAKQLQCPSCCKATYTPPINLDEAIDMSINALRSAASELSSAANFINDADSANHVRLWSKSKAIMAEYLAEQARAHAPD